ncbi:HAD family hydrolase [Vibrio sp. TRT 17S01]|uniref:HAD family hydrolase n=1 Tax=Vibrio sp. TRT 17S01 TaxID=3418505 RepID=UPI003CF2A292
MFFMPYEKDCALLFDMNGLIFETELAYQRSWYYAAFEQGIFINEYQYTELIGISEEESYKIIENLYRSKIDMVRFKAVREAYYLNLTSTVPVFKRGFRDLFDQAIENGIPCVLVTSSPYQCIEFNFSKTDLLEKFELIISGEDLRFQKVTSETYHFISTKLKLPTRKCIVFERSNYRIKASRMAGCTTIMIPDLEAPCHYSKKYAHRIFLSLAEVNLQGLRDSLKMSSYAMSFQ